MQSIDASFSKYCVCLSTGLKKGFKQCAQVSVLSWCACSGFRLDAGHVIHTVGPVYSDDATSAPELASAYRSSLKLANENVSLVMHFSYPHLFSKN